MIQDDQSRESQRMSENVKEIGNRGCDPKDPELLDTSRHIRTHPDTSIHPRPPLARIT